MFDHLRNLATTGAFCSIGKSASKTIAKVLHTNIPHDIPTTVLELGAGTGNITKYLCKNKRKLIVYEVIKKFSDHLDKKFGTNDGVIVMNKSAENIIQDWDKGTIDGIVSTLPLSLIGQKGEDIIQQSYSVLKPGGIFVMGQIRSMQNALLKKTIGRQIYAKRIRGLQPIIVTAYQKLR